MPEVLNWKDRARERACRAINQIDTDLIDHLEENGKIADSHPAIQEDLHRAVIESADHVAPTPREAVEILEELDPPERGLWEGHDDPLDAVRSMGHYALEAEAQRQAQEIIESLNEAVSDAEENAEWYLEDVLGEYTDEAF